MVLVQKWPFFQLFFLGNIGQENVFYDILEQKNAFLSYKNKKFKKSKHWHFYKGLTHGYCPKKATFPTLFFLSNIGKGNVKGVFLGNLGQKNVFKDILEPKNAFLSYKKKKLKKSKNWHFSKGVNPCFWPKNSHFSTFFL